jgi:hypothetical protein
MTRGRGKTHGERQDDGQEVVKHSTAATRKRSGFVPA